MYAYANVSSIWVRFSISVFAEITGCSVSCRTQHFATEANQCSCSLSLLCIDDDHWKISSAQHTHTHTHPHPCTHTLTHLTTNTDAWTQTQLLTALSGIWVLGESLDKNIFSLLIFLNLPFLTFLNSIITFFAPSLLNLYIFLLLFFTLFPSSHPSLQQCQSLRRADVSSRCWRRLVGDREGRGLPRTSFSSPPLELILPDIFSCFVGICGLSQSCKHLLNLKTTSV